MTLKTPKKFPFFDETAIRSRKEKEKIFFYDLKTKKEQIYN